MSSATIRDRTEDHKKTLILWRHILIPLNNLLEWEHQYDPLIIFGSLTGIFGFIHLLNPSLLTLISCSILIIVLIDLLGPIGLESFYKNENWLVEIKINQINMN